jgi:hypothetical protein
MKKETAWRFDLIGKRQQKVYVEYSEGLVYLAPPKNDKRGLPHSG